ncbi:unnamed protein product [Parnassius apollo]|uniref:(apollo) hypothetical protein n=1 Tax=Parnassius apollo TaxID=110799 RepID=A0A8S3WI58_PARAO|nr:unnamed protein product [Parnassius apollo]
MANTVQTLFSHSLTPLGTVKMTSRKNLSENEIQNLLLDVRDEDEVFLGDELEDELDEIIPDFRDEQVPVEEDGSNHETDLESSEEEIEEDIVQVRITNSPVTVLTVPEVLRGKGTKKQRTSEIFLWYGTHRRSSRTPQRNIIFHAPGNKALAKFTTSALDSWKLFFYG